jgi:hypothetical protein
MRAIAGAAVVLLATCAYGGDERGMIVGTWVKERAQLGAAAYPDDAKWQFAVTYDADGRFTWESTWTENGEKVDASAKGSYTVDGKFITYHFEKPSVEARQKFGEVMEWRPMRTEGKQAFHLQENELLLSYPARELVIHLKKKEAE